MDRSHIWPSRHSRSAVDEKKSEGTRRVHKQREDIRWSLYPEADTVGVRVEPGLWGAIGNSNRISTSSSRVVHGAPSGKLLQESESTFNAWFCQIAKLL